MPRTKLSEYSTTNSANTDIESINIDEGCAPSGINNAIRELMVHLKEFQTGASGDAFTFAGGVLISGTANTITGNVLMSGTNTITGSTTATFAAGAVGTPSIAAHGDTNTGIFFPAADTIAFAEGGAEAMRIDSSGNVKLSAAGTSILNSSGNKILNQTGSVLQVVEGSTDTQVTVSTATYTDTGLTATITPTSASSKILVIFSQQAASGRTAANAEMNIDIQLLRGSTVLEEYADYAMVANATGLALLGMQVCATYLDSPNTTSSTTYKLQGRPDSTANSQNASFQTGNRGRSSIILMEIAA